MPLSFQAEVCATVANYQSTPNAASISRSPGSPASHSYRSARANLICLRTWTRTDVFYPSQELAGKCATCHMVMGRGRAVGPDLSDVGQEMKVVEIRER